MNKITFIKREFHKADDCIFGECLKIIGRKFKKNTNQKVDSAYALFKGIQIFYNFIDKHGALNGKSPSELAIPELKFESANRWLELIKLAD